MIKRKVNVFPDYTSTGLWLVNTEEERKIHAKKANCTNEDSLVMWEHVSVTPGEVFVSPTLQLTLKYWHEIWEFCIGYQYDKNDVKKYAMSKPYIERWKEDGRKLAELMSEENQFYYFVYVDSIVYKD